MMLAALQNRPACTVICSNNARRFFLLFLMRNTLSILLSLLPERLRDNSAALRDRVVMRCIPEIARTLDGVVGEGAGRALARVRWYVHALSCDPPSSFAVHDVCCERV